MPTRITRFVTRRKHFISTHTRRAGRSKAYLIQESSGGSLGNLRPDIKNEILPRRFIRSHVVSNVAGYMRSEDRQVDLFLVRAMTAFDLSVGLRVKRQGWLVADAALPR